MQMPVEASSILPPFWVFELRVVSCLTRSPKAGLIQMTRALALEWARHQIRVNAIAPGYIQTNLNTEFLDSESGQKLQKRIPMHRFGQREELAGPLLLLASDAGAYMTGSVVTADGGHLVSTLVRTTKFF